MLALHCRPHYPLLCPGYHARAVLCCRHQLALPLMYRLVCWRRATRQLQLTAEAATSATSYLRHVQVSKTACADGRIHWDKHPICARQVLRPAS